MLLPLEVLLLLTVVGRWVIECKVEPDGQGGGSISMGMDFNDEYDHSTHMPTELRCDACRVIAYQLTKKFNEAHEKRPSIKKFEESEIIDITDSICDQDWKEYGIKFMDNVKRMSGEGLETNELPGVMQTGGKIPERLRKICKQWMGDLEDMEIYDQYLLGDLESYLCKGDGIRNACVIARDATRGEAGDKKEKQGGDDVQEMTKKDKKKDKKKKKNDGDVVREGGTGDVEVENVEDAETDDKSLNNDGSIVKDDSKENKKPKSANIKNTKQQATEQKSKDKASKKKKGGIIGNMKETMTEFKKKSVELKKERKTASKSKINDKIKVRKQERHEKEMKKREKSGIPAGEDINEGTEKQSGGKRQGRNRKNRAPAVVGTRRGSDQGKEGAGGSSQERRRQDRFSRQQKNKKDEL